MSTLMSKKQSTQCEELSPPSLTTWRLISQKEIPVSMTPFRLSFRFNHFLQHRKPSIVQTKTHYLLQIGHFMCLQPRSPRKLNRQCRCQKESQSHSKRNYQLRKLHTLSRYSFDPIKCCQVYSKERQCTSSRHRKYHFDWRSFSRCSLAPQHHDHRQRWRYFDPHSSVSPL